MPFWKKESPTFPSSPGILERNTRIIVGATLCRPPGSIRRPLGSRPPGRDGGAMKFTWAARGSGEVNSPLRMVNSGFMPPNSNGA